MFHTEDYEQRWRHHAAAAAAADARAAFAMLGRAMEPQRGCALTLADHAGLAGRLAVQARMLAATLNAESHSVWSCYTDSGDSLGDDLRNVLRTAAAKVHELAWAPLDGATQALRRATARLPEGSPSAVCTNSRQAHAARVAESAAAGLRETLASLRNSLGPDGHVTVCETLWHISGSLSAVLSNEAVLLDWAQQAAHVRDRGECAAFVTACQALASAQRDVHAVVTVLQDQQPHPGRTGRA